MRFDPQSYTIKTGSDRVRVPFKIVDEHIVLSGEIGGKRLNFIFDSGMPVDGALIFRPSPVDDLDPLIIGKIPLMSPGGEPVESDLASGLTISFPGIDLNNQLAILVPPDARRREVFREKQAVIGFSLLGRFVVEIDFLKMEMVLHKPANYVYAGSGEEIPLTISNNYPYLDATIQMEDGKEVPAHLVVDLGSGHPLALNAGRHENLILPKQAIKSRIGRSVAADVMGYVGRIKNLKLGRYTVTDIVTRFHPAENQHAAGLEQAGRLGGPSFFMRFHTIFDYQRKRLILEPNEYVNEPFEYDMSGIQYTRTLDDKFRIDFVIEGSAAEETGLTAGDIITGINGRSTQEISADEFNHIVKQDGRIITVSFIRNGQAREVSLKLRKQV